MTDKIKAHIREHSEAYGGISALIITVAVICAISIANQNDFETPFWESVSTALSFIVVTVILLFVSIISSNYIAKFLRWLCRSKETTND